MSICLSVCVFLFSYLSVCCLSVLSHPKILFVCVRVCLFLKCRYVIFKVEIPKNLTDRQKEVTLTPTLTLALNYRRIMICLLLSCVVLSCLTLPCLVVCACVIMFFLCSCVSLSNVILADQTKILTMFQKLLEEFSKEEEVPPPPIFFSC